MLFIVTVMRMRREGLVAIWNKNDTQLWWGNLKCTWWSKVSVHLIITIQKVTSNVQSVPRQSPDIYWHAELCSSRLCSVLNGPHSECILWWSSSAPQFFCTVIIRCTETFWSPCINHTGNQVQMVWQSGNKSSKKWSLIGGETRSNSSGMLLWTW
jgi:hypothetical protein